ncbi:resistant to fluoxetine 6-like [Octopus vulgaris]|uniref:Resistant to fluoxetine 6-like n=2 Tax=Octopus vulgaris TaxID=6645 RepID=A0AA36FPF4_OCTVU|nr:resistant to fluoxetine 6-like [Octopus vulgaris]
MNTVAFLLVLILPGVVSDPGESLNYWKVISAARQRYTHEKQGLHQRHESAFEEGDDPGVEFEGYSTRDNSTLERAKQLLSMNVCDSVSALNVSRKCCEDTKTILTSLVQRQMWAIQMIDSYGKIPSGIMLGDYRYPGSYDECKAIDVLVPINKTSQIKRRPFSPKYCQVVLPNEALKMFMSYGVPGIYMGICVPDSCHENDINTLMYTGIHFLPIKIREKLKPFAYCDNGLDFDGKAIFSIVASSLYLLVIVAATLYDIFTTNCLAPKTKGDGTGEKNGHLPIQNGTGSQVVLTQKDEKVEPGVGAKLLLCFSVYHNGTKFLNTNQSEGTLSCVHGIRFLSMTWVLLGHVYVFGITVFKNPVTLGGFMKQFAFQAIGNATVSVDSFFLLSGLLVAYSTLKAFSARDGKMNWVYFYIHRYWRLTPPILLLMMVYIPLFRYIGDGPFWPQQGTEVNFCKESWFYNILYLNNFLPTEQTKQCMGWLWYLANDMQFYWISPLLLVPLYFKPKIGQALTALLLLAHFICTGFIATNDQAQLNMLGGNNNNNNNQTTANTFQDIYVKPYTRIGPYLIGLLYGYYLYKFNCKLRINKYVNTVLWLMATISAVAVLYGLYNNNNGYYITQETASFYTAVSRTVWGVCLGWVVLACCTNNGGFVNTLLSWKALIPLSRLTYCAYLVHPIILFYFYFNQRYPLAPTQVTFVFLFLGCLGVTFMVAFLASMAFEAPMLGLEKVLLQKLKIRK